MNVNAQGFMEHINSPWGKMQYRLMWEQLDFAQGMRVLDFGSGFGVTASRLAMCNEVVAVEPADEMLAMCVNEHDYKQIRGGIDDLPDEQFDLVLCHNVLEFVEDWRDYAARLIKCVKPGGKLSLVKHNLAGKAMRQAAADNDPAGALALMQGELPENNFGKVRLFGTDEFIGWAAAQGFAAERHYGIRMFYNLSPNNDNWDDPAWVAAIYALEQHAAQLEPYRSIAFFHHLLLRKQIAHQ